VSTGRADPVAPLRAEEAGLLACVHCGFCLSACPTYNRLGHEGDSPRGRLDLMRAVMEGRLPPEDESYRRHIDQCLGCRACEPVCPSGVPYGFLLERARAAIAETTGVSWSTRLLIAAFTGPLAPLAGAASRFFRATRLPRALVLLPAGLGPVRFALAMLASSAPWPRLRSRSPQAAPGAAPSNEPRPLSEPAVARRGHTDDVGGSGERAVSDPHGLMGAYPVATAAPADATPAAATVVAMLTGCVQAALFGRVNSATDLVLRENGCVVHAAPGQVCCGALDAHAGRLERAAALARRNIEAFEAAGVERVVVNAAGCGAMLKEYGEQLRHDPDWAERARRFSASVVDAAELLAARGIRPGAPVSVRVAYDAPCHLHHGQRIREAPLRLLDAVPGLERVPLRDADECCGGAGLYGVHHPDLGGRILADKVDAVLESGADVVTTPNPGCHMQIGAGLLLRGSDVGIVHPLEILAESYRREKA